eukprot:TRINITY_DN29825_c0_g1_i1.p2 TRINITY_DN29825_c0_g1~~TRINITY_DN29825_c0_g1_i1.p2  ORF type:complete len:149 (-),score=1.09 TRINITY_DN29825_c0_g1_i1:396-842(-)
MLVQVLPHIILCGLLFYFVHLEIVDADNRTCVGFDVHVDQTFHDDDVQISWRMVSSEKCCALCRSEPQCKAWSLYDGRCYMTSVVPASLVASKGAISATIKAEETTHWKLLSNHHCIPNPRHTRSTVFHSCGRTCAAAPGARRGSCGR